MSEPQTPTETAGDPAMTMTSADQRTQAPSPRPARRPGDAIVLDGVTVRYETQAKPARTVLSDIDLTIAKGEFVALVGRSGCGKTTLLNLVAGLVDPSAGSATVLGTQPRAARGQAGCARRERPGS